MVLLPLRPQLHVTRRRVYLPLKLQLAPRCYPPVGAAVVAWGPFFAVLGLVVAAQHHRFHVERDHEQVEQVEQVEQDQLAVPLPAPHDFLTAFLPSSVFSGGSPLYLRIVPAAMQ